MSQEIVETESGGPGPAGTRQEGDAPGPLRRGLSIEVVLLALALASLAGGLTVSILDLEHPGRVLDGPVVTASRPCYYDDDQRAVVAPYVATGRNDGEVWLKIRVHVDGVGRAPVVRPDALRSPDGDYEMRSEALVELVRRPQRPETVTCRFTAGPWR